MSLVLMPSVRVYAGIRSTDLCGNEQIDDYLNAQNNP